MSERTGKPQHYDVIIIGGGRCNFTNLFVGPNNFVSKNPHFCKSALSRYTQWDFIALAEKHGIPYHERKHGELFCDDSAKDILNMLLAECSDAGVEIKTHCDITAIAPPDEEHDHYRLNTSLGAYACQSLVIATGGLSIPTMGASDFGYKVAKQFGLNIIPTRAGLVPFTFTDQTKALTERLSGLALDVIMSTGNMSFRENILFTHRGISGPVALQLSSYWRVSDSIEINLLPDLDAEAWLLSLKDSSPKVLLRTPLSQQLAKNLTLELQHLFWPVEAETELSQISHARLKEIAHHLGHWTLKPSGTEGYRTAEVTLGGVDTDAISSKTMECKTQKGLYFIGEVLDVSGHLGGFNFQWAWASGVAAGECV
jgi:predicted Rossmann fold flavoprotein